MKKLILVTTMCLLALIAVARADFVTVHGTVGLLETMLVTKTGEEVGTVGVWNTRTQLNVIVTPKEGEFLLSKVYVYLSTEEAPPPYTADGEEQEVEPDFGEWPYRVKYKDASADPYELNVDLKDVRDLEWGRWG